MALRTATRIGRAGALAAAFLLVALTGIAPAGAAAAAAAPSGPARLCETAARRAAARTGVPLDVLRAIALAETGRPRAGRLAPWPWTANFAGEGRWFATRAELLDAARGFLAQGRESFDLGCFQINYRWHGRAFASLAEMAEPDANALYAARFLSRLHAELGDWASAAGAYHSRTPQNARRYRARFVRLRAGLPGGPEPAVAPRPRREPRRDAPAGDGYPLLHAGGGRRGLGSLVPEIGRAGPGLRGLPGREARG